MGVHLDESKSTIRLESSLGDVSEVLEKRDQVGLGSVRCEITNIARRLPLRGLLDNHVVALYSVRGEVMVAKGGGGGHAHGGHGLLLRDGGLSLLVGPVATDCPGAQPFAIHGAESTLSVGTIPESNETVAAGPPRLHVPHDTGLRHRAEGAEGLKQDLIVHLVGQIAHEDVEVVGRVLLRRIVGLVGPVDANLL